jgi:dihydrofolate reductase
MRKIIAAINMTIDGFCDHTAGLPDEEIHGHYANLLDHAGVILYGRITYQLMQYWQGLLKNPSGEKSMDEFARSIDRVPKIVFSNSLDETGWESARLSDKPLEEKVLELKPKEGKDILVGSRSLIIQLMNLRLVDEFQLCIHPVVAGGGLPLFENLNAMTIFKLAGTRSFSGGAVLLYYHPAKK